MTNPEFEMYIWAGLERFKCPSPCLRNYETEEECLSCWQSCRNHPKPKPPKVIERVSPIVSAKGAPITVVEVEKPEELDEAFDEVPEADATGEP